MSKAEEYMNTLSEEKIQQYKETLKTQGYIHVTNLPDNFDYLRFVQFFGNLMPQYDGQLVCSIKPDPQFADTYHALNSQPLLPHTECYEVEGAPPKYLSLWCIKAAEGGSGQTTLADGYAFVDSLSTEERTTLASHICQFYTGKQTTHYPIYDLNTVPNTPILRCSLRFLKSMRDPFITDIRQRLGDFFERTHASIFYQKNSIVIWDNWRILHARPAFEDQSRHLKRVWLSHTTG